MLFLCHQMPHITHGDHPPFVTERLHLSGDTSSKVIFSIIVQSNEFDWLYSGWGPCLWCSSRYCQEGLPSEACTHSLRPFSGSPTHHAVDHICANWLLPGSGRLCFDRSSVGLALRGLTRLESVGAPSKVIIHMVGPQGCIA